MISVGLTNGGFEQDLDGNTQPDDWSSNTWFTTDPVTARSGAFAGRHQASNNANYTVSQQIEGITPGKGYRFEGWVNIPSTSDSFSFRVDIRWLNANSDSLGTTTIQRFNAATNGWTPIQRIAPLIAPSTATRAEVRMVLSSLAATVLVDDFSFVNASLLTNGDFEIDLNGDNRPDSWTSSARFLRTTANVYNGTFAGRHNTTANASYTISQTITGISASNAYTFSGAVAIPPTTDTFALTIDIQWRNDTNTVLGVTTVRSYTTNTAGWEAFTELLTPPPNAARAVVRMTLNSLNGTIDVDTFAFE